jgi:hypothetical protein
MAARASYRPQGLALLGLAIFLGLTLSARAASLNLTASPELVEIGAFFRGQEITVTGEIPAGAQAVVEVLGPAVAEKLMRKGRRGGLWMNVSELEVKGAPSLYLVGATSPALLASAASAASCGYPALKRQIVFSGQSAGQEQEELLAQFLKLKESEGLYGAMSAPLQVSPAAGGAAMVQGTFRLPTSVKPGAYQVCLSVIEGGQVSARKCTELKVTMVGLPALFHSLAFEHGGAYGILAVILAIATGLIMGFLFKGRGGAH